ncbi:serine hydrolase [Nonomuraea sp. ZG12]|uniref:serine hydrolase n=1 Tax=Nonomuraea sp. ZG12 TaxID=3452207 RepID=UPI003F89D2E2
MRTRWWAGTALVMPLFLSPVGCAGAAAPIAPAAASLTTVVARCVLTLPDAAAAAAARARLTRQADRYLRGRPGRIVYSAHDLVSGVRLGHGAHEDGLITASGVKVDILMARLARRDRLSESERDLASRMIRRSDNLAADALWWRIGGGTGLSAYYRRIGLAETIPGPTRYWGGTRTSPADRIRLLELLVDGGGGLSAAERGLVLGLMGHVHHDQGWGVSAAARTGDRVALKNGWVPRPSARGTWAVTSYGRVTGPGRDLLLSVQTDLQPGHGQGIQSIEGLARLIGSRLGTLTPTRTGPCAAHPGV